MPRPQHPPTPVSSTEIKSKDGSQYPSLQMSFELPPPAVAGSGSQSSSASRKTSTASSYQPGSPTSPATASEVVKTRRRSSIVPVPAKDAFALPPPPTRSRKIIQMKPRGQNDAAEEEVVDTVTAKTGTKATTGSKKKPPSSTSVAGRKIARKTAHSLIERRRRSKMNEEFGVLKDMIPACTGDMHKLAILQASIDYIRYLEDCVSKLKASNAQSQASAASEHFKLPPPASLAAYIPRQYLPEQEQDDVDMDASDQATSPTTAVRPHSHSSRPSVSPAMLPQDRHDSYSSNSTSTEQRHYSFSAGTSPALGPTSYHNDPTRRQSTSIGSAFTSPALVPLRDSALERELDQEATAALLMLNCDRRGIHGGGRGMSVKDLLSS